MAEPKQIHKWEGQLPDIDIKNKIYRIEPSMSALQFIALDEKIKSDIRKSNIEAKRNKTTLVLGGLHG